MDPPGTTNTKLDKIWFYFGYVCLYIFMILDPDAYMYDAWMHDACIHNSFIYMILDPDASVYDAGMKDAYICDL